MKKYFITLIIFTFFTESYSQNFTNSTFAHNGVNYNVFSDGGTEEVGIYNAANSQNIIAKVLYRTRRINYQQLKTAIVGVFKSILTTSQVANLQSEKIVIIDILVDGTGKINLVDFSLDYNTYLTQANIYNIEIALKNIVVQFQDGLPPEAGQLGSIGIPKRMWR